MDRDWGDRVGDSPIATVGPELPQLLDPDHDAWSRREKMTLSVVMEK